MPLYPLKFVPRYKTKVWGGQMLGSLLNRELPTGEPIGESWELVDRDNDNSIIRNGVWAGLSLRDLLQKERPQIMGERLALRYPAEFPLLIKFIDASDDLSVQVHPDDEMAYGSNMIPAKKTGSAKKQSLSTFSKTRSRMNVPLLAVSPSTRFRLTQNSLVWSMTAPGASVG